MSNNLHRIQAAIGLRYLQSFSAMRVTMGYLTPYEQHHTQHICIWFYNFGTSRVQTKINLPSFLFT